jgi:hypothetical protein
VSPSLFLVFVLFGGAAVAVWINTRYPKLAPEELRRALIHVGVSLVVAQLAVPLLIKDVVALGTPAAILFAIFGIAFPALTYCLLSSIWIIKACQGALRH